MADPNLAPPSINPTDYGSLNGVLLFVLQKFLQHVDDMLPAKVISFDRTLNRVQVQPLIAMVTTDNKIVQRAPLLSVPVIQLGGGGFTMNFPLKAGDIGFIKANDRDMSLFLQSLKATIPNTARKHSFEDAVFIPTVLAGYSIDPVDADNLVIQKLDSSVKITLSDNKIRIEAPTIEIQSTVGDTTIDGRAFLPHVHTNVMPGSGNSGPVA